ncbi:hypothetical protein K438DRAFT_1945106 [Mycena galopus ATCC 62051]|nr:hypothetical protein K438DRAFT_1945106 [Mycena galopus ATCC 62051]
MTSSARAPLRDRNVITNEEGQKMSPSPPPEPESTRIARLEAELEAMKAQRDHADAALCAERQRAPVTRREHETAADESIPRPPNAAKMLDLEKMEWNAIRTATRDALTAAQLDMERNWKAQKPSKLAMAYNALTYLEVEERFPVLRQCEGQWGIDRIAKQTLSNRKSYQSCVRNPSTYCGHRAEARRTTIHRAAVRVAAARRTPSHTPPATPSPIAAPSPRRSPSAGPSQPRRRAQLQRVLSFDGDDDLMNFDNDLQDNGDEGDEPELSASEGKKRAAPPDGQPQKRSRRD